MELPGSQNFGQFASALGTTMDFAAGDFIFRENEAPRYLYFVLSGAVEISIRDKPIEIVHAGQAVGLLSMIDERPRTVTAQAKERCELALIDRKKFRYMVEEIPNFVWYVLSELGMRLHAANDKM